MLSFLWIVHCPMCAVCAHVCVCVQAVPAVAAAAVQGAQALFERQRSRPITHTQEWPHGGM